jgi:hypothetical protein
MIFSKKVKQGAGRESDEAIQKLGWCLGILDCLTFLSKIKQMHFT